MYNDCVQRANKEGFEQYEISNFCKPGHECQHNLCYWNAEEYAGYGPGAVGRIGTVRSTNLKHPDRYSQAVEAGETLGFDPEELGPDILRMEQIMLGLRLNRGLVTSNIKLDPREVQKLSSRNWIIVEGERIKLTDEGRHFCSEVALALV